MEQQEVITVRPSQGPSLPPSGKRLAELFGPQGLIRQLSPVPAPSQLAVQSTNAVLPSSPANRGKDQQPLDLNTMAVASISTAPEGSRGDLSQRYPILRTTSTSQAQSQADPSSPRTPIAPRASAELATGIPQGLHVAFYKWMGIQRGEARTTPHTQGRTPNLHL